MEYLKKLNDKDPNISDNSIKQMYSCGHLCKNASASSNLFGIIIILLVSSYCIYRFINKPVGSNISQILNFAKEQEIFKMFIGLIILTNIKTLSNSFIANIALPLVKPILPIISCNIKIKVGLFDICIGEFISDTIVFLVNMYIMYFLFQIIY